MNDTEASAFIRTFYGRAVAAIYDAFPVGVMRGDFWRYAILYAYGGIYADVDTECLRPLSGWFPPLVRPGGGSESPAFVQGVPGALQQLRYGNLTWQDCGLVIAMENDVHLCQWIIAAAPGHPLMRSVLQASLRSVQDGFRCSYEHMVHAHTGPGIFTQGIREGMGLPDHYSAADIARAAWTNATVYQRAREMRVCFVAGEFWGDYGQHKAQNAKNHFSSLWEGGNSTTTPSWTLERQQLVKKWASASPAVGGGGGAGGGEGDKG
jgi:alpha 1,6-mannosyltransferase